MFMRTGRRRYASSRRTGGRVQRKRFVWETATFGFTPASGTLVKQNLLTGLETVLGENITGWRVERVIGQVTCYNTTAATLNVHVATGVLEAGYTPAAGTLGGAGPTDRYDLWQWYEVFRSAGSVAVTDAVASPYGIYTRRFDIASKRLLRYPNAEYDLVMDNVGAGAAAVTYTARILTSTG